MPLRQSWRCAKRQLVPPFTCWATLSATCRAKHLGHADEGNMVHKAGIVCFDGTGRVPRLTMRYSFH